MVRYDGVNASFPDVASGSVAVQGSTCELDVSKQHGVVEFVIVQGRKFSSGDGPRVLRIRLSDGEAALLSEFVGKLASGVERAPVYDYENTFVRYWDTVGSVRFGRYDRAVNEVAYEASKCAWVHAMHGMGLNVDVDIGFECGKCCDGRVKFWEEDGDDRKQLCCPQCGKGV